MRCGLVCHISNRESLLCELTLPAIALNSNIWDFLGGKEPLYNIEMHIYRVSLQLNNQFLGKEAELFKKLPNGRVKCTACAKYCEIPEGKDGLCGIRGVTNGRLQLHAYGRVIAGHIDPIEKKPVTHYMPGSSIYSIATTGCNWLCK